MLCRRAASPWQAPLTGSHSAGAPDTSVLSQALLDASNTGQKCWYARLTHGRRAGAQMSDLVKPSEEERDTNFQRASMTLDAGVKIYATRVDSVHTAAYQVLTGLSRAGPAAHAAGAGAHPQHGSGDTSMAWERDSWHRGYLHAAGRPYATLSTWATGPLVLPHSCTGPPPCSRAHQ